MLGFAFRAYRVWECNGALMLDFRRVTLSFSFLVLLLGENKFVSCRMVNFVWMGLGSLLLLGSCYCAYSGQLFIDFSFLGF